MTRLKRIRRGLLIAASGLSCLLATPAPAQAIPVNDGTYTVDGGSYSIKIQREGDSIVVIEPNKRSIYQRKADGSYQVYNPNTDTVYGIRAVDDHTIEAFKPDRPDSAPTVLTRLGGSPAPVVAQRAGPTPIETTSIPASIPEPSPGDTYGIAARHYEVLSRSDPDNAQTWTACAAAAQKRSTANPDEANAYAVKMAKVLKAITVDPSTSPCPDAIPAEIWAGTDSSPTPAYTRTPAQIARDQAAAEAAATAAAERARLDALNRQADEQSRRMIAKLEADRAAAAQEQARYQAAQHDYEARKAQNDAEVEAARRAREAYDKSIADYRATYGKPR